MPWIPWFHIFNGDIPNGVLSSRERSLANVQLQLVQKDGVIIVDQTKKVLFSKLWGHNIFRGEWLLGFII